MDVLLRVDEAALLWLNGWVGRFPWLDAVATLLASDYLVLVLMSLVLLGLWFTGRTPERRDANQRAVLASLLGVVAVDAVVMALNQSIYRPRPFADPDVALLFYRPTDSSFPANPPAVAFAVATGVWLRNRGVGLVLLGMAAVLAVLRVYVGVFYPLDVIAGAAIGGGVGVAVTLALRFVEPLPTLVLRLARAMYLA